MISTFKTIMKIKQRIKPILLGAQSIKTHCFRKLVKMTEETTEIDKIQSKFKKKTELKEINLMMTKIIF